jgi:hypothetical protein
MGLVQFEFFIPMSPMQGRVFLETAKTLIPFDTEDCLRAAAGRAYYALFLECRDTLDQWGFKSPTFQGHQFVRTRFEFASATDLHEIGAALRDLGELRNQADYENWHSMPFLDDSEAVDAVRRAEAALVILDAIDSDPSRRAGAIAAIRAIP